LKVDGRPYTEQVISRKSFTRIFSTNIDESELHWHRDENDRKITVVSGTGWRYQEDNKLPVLLCPGDHLFIKSGVWHRILMGSTDLKILIEDDAKTG